MEYQDEKVWYEQELLSYSEISESRNLHISVSINCTEKYGFSSPRLSIVIYNPNLRLMFSLSLFDIESLIRKINESYEGRKRGNIPLDAPMVYQMNGKKKIRVVYAEDNQTVSLTLCDGLKEAFIFMPTKRLYDISNMLVRFTQDYPSLCSNFLQIRILRDMQKIFNDQFVKQQLILDRLTEHLEQLEVGQPIDSNISSKFGEYVKDNIDNMKLDIPKPVDGMPDLETGKKRVERIDNIDNSFSKCILKGDISYLEKLNAFLSTSNNPLFTLLGALDKKLLIYDSTTKELDKIQKFLPGIKDEDLKYILYCSRISFFKYMNYLTANKNNIQVPIITVWHYQGKNAKKFNMELAYELTAIICYLKIVRDTLSQLTTDQVENKTLVYTQTRFFLDMLAFSDYMGSNPESLCNIVLERYKNLKKCGVFKVYDELVKKHTGKEIDEKQVLMIISKILPPFTKSGYKPWIDRPDKCSGNFKLTKEQISNFTYEQITNKIVRIEIGDLKNEKLEDCESEILSLYGLTVSPGNETNLGRFLRNHDKQIPQELKDEFLTIINTEFKDKSYDFKKYKNKFKLQEFGDDILIALYFWKPQDPETGKNLTGLYSTYRQTYTSIKRSFTDGLIPDLRATISGLEIEDEEVQEIEGSYNEFLQEEII